MSADYICRDCDPDGDNPWSVLLTRPDFDGARYPVRDDDAMCPRCGSDNTESV